MSATIEKSKSPERKSSKRATSSGATSSRDAPSKEASSAGSFILTKEYHRFEEFCEACRRERYIGLCYGPAGVGKTLAARHYSKRDLIERHADNRFHYSRDSMPPVPPEAADCHTVFYTAPVANTPRVVKEGLYDTRMALERIGGLAEADQKKSDGGASFANRCKLVLVDEADRLKTPSLEEIRDQYDKGDFGLVLIGMPGIEKRLSRYPQLYSRVGFAHAFRPLSVEEMKFVLARRPEALGHGAEDFADVEATATIARITGGNFRLLDRLLRQAKRIMEINRLKHLTREVVEAARECLVIGPS